MNLKEIRSKFPLRVKVTQEIIDTADIDNCNKCIGALTLKKALNKYLEENHHIGWGVWNGDIVDTDQVEDSIDITTKYEVNMMEIKSPQYVTFILRE